MDLLQLAQITYVKSQTARLFWEAGFRSVGAIAAANVNDIVPVLFQVFQFKLESNPVFGLTQCQAQPKTIRLDLIDERNNQQKLHTKAEIILKSANRLWGKSSFFNLTKNPETYSNN